MLQSIILGILVAGLATVILLNNFKEFENERNDINLAKNITDKNKVIGNLIAIEKLTQDTNFNSDLTNSQMLASKPLDFKISYVENASERALINKYEEAVKKVFETDPNGEPDCVILSQTNFISEEDCEKIHTKSYEFFHKTEKGDLAYKVENENINKYVKQIEAYKHNLKPDDFSDEKIVVDSRFLEVNSPFLTNQSLIKKREALSKIEKGINTDDYLLASSNLYNLKKGNYQDDKALSSLYVKLIEDVEKATKESLKDSEEYELRLKIQTEFLKLSNSSNILESLKNHESSYVKNFVDSISLNFDEIKEKEELLSEDGSVELPTREVFLEKVLILNKQN